MNIFYVLERIFVGNEKRFDVICRTTDSLDRGCSFLVLGIHHPACFPDLPELPAADRLDQVCSFSQNAETSHQRLVGFGDLEDQE